MGYDAPDASDASSAVSARIRDLRQRFQRAAQPVIGAGLGAQFESLGEGHIRVVIPEGVESRVPRPVTVTLPTAANGTVRLEDDTSHASVAFRIVAANAAPIATTREGVALYSNAIAHAAGLVHRVSADGAEDFVAFETRPEREELAYEVDVSGVAGLRLVSNMLEFLEANGNPALRIATPYVVSASGATNDATLSVQLCAYDSDPRGPWRRPVTNPGRETCRVTVQWHSESYPAILDPAWMTTGALTTPRAAHTSTVLANGQVLLTGGFSTPRGGAVTYLATAELYDPTTKSFSPTGTMNSTRGFHTATLLASGGQVLIVGGVGSNPNISELYSPTTGGFAQTTGTASGPLPRHTATLLGPAGSNKVLIAVGGGGSVPELYDPATQAFTPTTGQMVTPRSNHTATLLSSGEVLIVGGNDPTSLALLASAELYDPTSQTFSATGSMSAARDDHTATLLASGQVLVAGGLVGSSLSSTAELYDRSSQAFGPTAGGLVAARRRHTATLLGSGQVLLAGGSGGASAELYDPTTTTFAATEPMLVALFWHGASLLGSGGVLVSGGSASDGTSLQSAELFGVVAAGSGCGSGTDCSSGVCANGTCCTGACSGTCMGCSGTGACIQIRSADDIDNCTRTMTCGPSGACGLKNGQPSSSPSACASGFASDALCCDLPCAGQCQACDVVGKVGACSIVPSGAPHGGRAACSGSGACGGTCNGAADACAYPLSGTQCASSCNNAISTTSSCDGNGGCIGGQPIACPQNFSCRDSMTCNTSCARNADCHAGFQCASDGTCIPTAMIGDAGSPTEAGGPDGGDASVANCAPYAFDPAAGMCKTTCASVSDCVAPAVCNSNGQCVGSPGIDNPGGCTCSTSLGSDRALPWLLPLAGASLAGALRRRQRRVRPSHPDGQQIMHSSTA